MKLSVNVGAAASSDGGGDGTTPKTTPSPTIEGRKAAPSASATAMLKPFKALVVTCVAALLYALALS